MNRLRQLQDCSFDVIVIGGGIIGAGVARDAALRGLKVALFEKNDFSAGTTSGSSRLIHGGLRYLEMLDFRLVRMDLREREILLQIAPHLIRPLEFILPFYDRSAFYRLKMKIGMMLYHRISSGSRLPSYRFLTAAQVQSAEPGLKSNGLQGGVSYYDAQVTSPERLCLENLIDAAHHGASVVNYAAVTGLLRSGGGVEGVVVKDFPSGERMHLRAPVVVNATGAWLDRVSKELMPAAASRLRTTKGIHIAFPAVNERAVVLFSSLDARLFFVIPWLGYSWVGTTDTDYLDDPGQARATGEDVRYLLRSVQEYFPSLHSEGVLYSNCGVRALVKKSGRESDVSRMHRVADEKDNGVGGLISVLGGKITGYRAIAEEVTDLVCAKLGKGRTCSTATDPLPGCQSLAVGSSASGLNQETIRHLHSIYGSRACEVIEIADEDPRHRQRLSEYSPDIAAQVLFAVRSEYCLRLSDFMLRRTMMGYSHDQGMSAVKAVAECMAREFGWSSDMVAGEIQSYEQHIRRTQAFRAELETVLRPEHPKKFTTEMRRGRPQAEEAED
ncbi:MAG TPA: glycerol-3-phosphate dehydrogenase/oxidase [Acidobacteriota bacterium]|jgi:glycerol-3-phosphate dehydrogenase